jgi:hypothetical protein
MHQGETRLSNLPIDASLTRDTSKRDDGLRPPTKVNANDGRIEETQKKRRREEKGGLKQHPRRPET